MRKITTEHSHQHTHTHTHTAMVGSLFCTPFKTPSPITSSNSFTSRLYLLDIFFLSPISFTCFMFLFIQLSFSSCSFLYFALTSSVFCFLSQSLVLCTAVTYAKLLHQDIRRLFVHSCDRSLFLIVNRANSLSSVFSLSVVRHRTLDRGVTPALLNVRSCETLNT